MKLHLKRLFWVAVIGGLLFLLVMCGAGGRYGCVASRYERFDIVRDGVYQMDVSGAAPAYSITDTPLVPASLKARSAYYNVTDLLECAREEKYAARISFIELRSTALTRVVERWRTHREPATGFRSGNMGKDRVIVSNGLHWPEFKVWDPAYVKETAPDWVPLQQLTEANWIAFWGGWAFVPGNAAGPIFLGRVPLGSTWSLFIL
jgi:hypothetical protein